MLHAPTQAGAEQTHGGAHLAAPGHRDVQRGAPCPERDVAEVVLAEIDAPEAQPGGAAEAQRDLSPPEDPPTLSINIPIAH